MSKPATTFNYNIALCFLSGHAKKRRSCRRTCDIGGKKKKFIFLGAVRTAIPFQVSKKRKALFSPKQKQDFVVVETIGIEPTTS